MKALVVGDTGLVGRYLVQLLLREDGWIVCGMSRRARAANAAAGGRHFTLVADLQDPDSIARALAGHRDITHVFYAGRAALADRQQECTVNTDMFVNLMSRIGKAGAALTHVQLMQGLKWYGSHAGPYKTPAREDDPRHPSPNFYYDQQDWLVEHIASAPAAAQWSWSAMRPHQVAGYSDQYPHNIAGVLALYGTFCRAQNIALDFPGSPACYESVSMLMDADLLAQAMLFTATQPSTRNRAFNVGNGDNFRWINLWPRLAAFFNVPCGQVGNFSLQERFGDSQAQWQQICDRHQLVAASMDAVANWTYGDFTFQAGQDDMASLTAIRSAGFSHWCDTEDALMATLTDYRDRQVIP